MCDDRLACILRSVRLSRLLVASSSSNILGFFRMARANATRCFSPELQAQCRLRAEVKDALSARHWLMTVSVLESLAAIQSHGRVAVPVAPTHATWIRASLQRPPAET